MNTQIQTALTIEQILAANDLPKRVEFVPEWNGTVMFLTLPGTARDEFELDMMRRNKVLLAKMKHSQEQGEGELDITPELFSSAIEELKGVKVNMLHRVLVKPDGVTPLMTEADLDKLNKKNGAVIDRLFKIAQEMNGLENSALKKRIKNSGGDRKDSAGTVSVAK